MRIAFSGAHCTGKTSLIAHLAELETSYDVVDEPYVALEEEGHEFAATPSFEDYELQLRRALKDLEEVPERALLDRCPLDFFAYMKAVSGELDEDEWLEEVREAMAKLDLLVFVPIEEPDKIYVDPTEKPKLRKKVDGLLRAMVLDDLYDLGIPTIEVEGSPEARVQQVRRAMKEKESGNSLARP